MDDSIEGLTRRALFVAGGIGTLALVGLAGATEAADAPAAAGPEKANVKLVETFIKSWSAKDLDAVMHSSTFLADDASVRMEEDKPPLIGPAAYAAAFKGFVSDGSRVKVKILQTFAKGPVVVNSRVDTVVSAGKPDQVFKVAGVFVVKNGKIKEWADYLVT